MDGTIFHTGENFVARDSNGAPVWRFTFPQGKSFIPTPPAIGPDGTIYAIAAVGTEYTIHALRSDGTEQWSFRSDEAFASSPVLGADGTVYFGTQNGSVYALKPNGNLLWKKAYSGAGSISPSILEDGLLLVGTTAGRLIRTTSEGENIWSTNLMGQLTPAVVSSNGLVYVGSSASKLYALNTDAHALEGRWSTLQGDVRRSGRAPYEADVPATPTNVIASAGSYPSRVAVTWSSAPNAVTYEVWRSPQEDPESRQLLQSGISAKNFYFDDTPATEPSLYWVRARNGTGPSLFGLGSRGFPAEGGPTGSWQFVANGPIWYSSPALGGNGEVYVQSSGINVTSGAPSTKGRVYALSKEGTVMWSVQTGQWGNSSPAVGNDGTIYVGTGFDSWTSSGITDVMGYLYAFNTNGSLKWKYPASQQIMNSPALGPDGTIYVGSLDYHVHAITPNGERKWIFNTGGIVHDALAISAEGTIYARAGHTLYAIGTNGVLKWQFNSGGAFAAPALNADGTVYLGVGADIVFGGPGVRSLLAMNPDGTVQWSFQTDSGVTSGAALGSDGTIYFGTALGQFYAVNRDGALKWVFKAGSTIFSTPAVRSDGSVCFGAQDGQLYILNSDGTLRTRLFTAAPITSSPAIDSNGRIYFGGEDRRIYAIADNFPLASSAWPMFGQTPAHPFRDFTDASPSQASNLVATASAESIDLSWGSAAAVVMYEVWRADVDDLGRATRLAQFVSTNAFSDRTASAGTQFYYWVRARNSYGVGEFSQSAAATRPLPAVGGIIWAHPTGPGRMIAASPALAPDGTIYVGTAQTNAQPLLEHHLYAFKPNGTVKWSAPVGGSLFSSPAVGSDGTIYVGSTDYGVYAFDPDGQRKWRFQGGFDPQRPFGSFTSSPAIGTNGIVYIGATDNRVYAINPDGTLYWSFAIASSSTAAPIYSSPALAADGTIFAAGGPHLFALTPDGGLLWSYRAANNFNSSPALGTDGTIYIANDDGNLHAVRPDGTRKWVYPTRAASSGSSPVIGPDETIYLASASSNLFAVTTNGVLKWEFPAAGALTTTPAVGADGNIFFGGSDQSFYVLNSSGALERKITIGSGVVSSPTIGSNHSIYFGANDGTFYIIRGETGPADAAWPAFHKDSQHTGRSQIPVLTPDAPMGIVASKDSSFGGVRVQWESTPWAVSYDILRNTVPELSSASLIATNISAATVYDDQSAGFGTNYFYWVRASNSAGQSEWSVHDVGHQNTKRWEIVLDSAVRSSPAVDPEGNIYLTTFNGPTNSGGKLISISRDGTQNWSFSPGVPISSTPSIASDGTVYFGAEDRKLYAFTSTGNKKWEVSLARSINSAPAIAQDDTVYVTTALDGRLYAISPAGLKLREFACRATGSSPSVGAEGAVYVQTTDRSLIAFGRDGRTNWTYRTPFGVTTSAAISRDGTIYVGEERRLTALTNGVLRWDFPTQSRPVSGTPAIGPSETIYFGTLDSKFYALRPDGTLLWQTNLTGICRSSPAITSDGRLYVITDQGILHVLDVSGAILHRLPIAAAPDSSPTIDPKGDLYIGSTQKKLFAFKTPSPLAPSSWPMFQKNARHTGADDSRSFLLNPLFFSESFTFRLKPAWSNSVTIERSEDLQSWTIVTNLSPLTGEVEVRDVNASGSKVFYRTSSR
ncbi:MAG TPA: PQQ-binding-like beta-propeller repeat protein [Verrucomicrobiae bacterium]